MLSFWPAALWPQPARCPVVKYCCAAQPATRAGQSICACSVQGFIPAGGPRAIVSELPWATWKTAAVQPIGASPRGGVIAGGCTRYKIQYPVPMPKGPAAVCVALRPPSCPILYVPAQ